MKILKLVLAGIAGGVSAYLGLSFFAMSWDWVTLTASEAKGDQFVVILMGRMIIVAGAWYGISECLCSNWYKGE